MSQIPALNYASTRSLSSFSPHSSRQEVYLRLAVPQFVAAVAVGVIAGAAVGTADGGVGGCGELGVDVVDAVDDDAVRALGRHRADSPAAQHG